MSGRESVTRIIAVVAFVYYLPVRAIVELLETYGSIAGPALAAHFIGVRILFPLLAVCVVAALWRTDEMGRTAVTPTFLWMSLATLGCLTVSASYVFSPTSDIIAFDGRSLRSFNAGVLQSWMMCMMIGILLPSVVEARVVLAAAWGAMMLTPLGFLDFANLALDVSSIGPERVSVYLLYGDVFAITACVFIASLRSSGSRLLVSIVSLVVSFTLYSRTSFFAFVCALLLVASITRRRLMVGAFAAVAMLVVIFGQQFETVLGTHRMLGFLEGGDESLLLRSEQLQQGLEALHDNWLFGDYGGQVRAGGEIGSYVHNVLSFWRQFGLLFFIALLYLLWRMLADWMSAAFRGAAGDNQATLVLLLTPLLLLEVAAARAYVYSFLWLGIGLAIASAACARSRHKSRELFVRQTRTNPVSSDNHLP